MAGRGSESALYEVVYPVFFVSRLFGQAPYSYPKNNEPPLIKPSWPSCTFTFIWFLAYSWNLVTVTVKIANIDTIAEVAKPILNYVVLILDMAIGIVKSEQLVDVWNSISEFDDIYQLSSPIDGKPNKYGSELMEAKHWLRFFIFISVVGWTSVNVAMFLFREAYFENICYMLPYVGTYITGFKFCGVVFLLGQRFAYLNKLVTKMTMDKNQRYTAFDMEETQAEYVKLMSTSERLNAIYSWILLLFISNLCYHVISTLHYVITWLMARPYIIGAEGLWLVMFLLQLLLVCITCDYTSQQWFVPSLHFLNRKLNFTAAGFFDANLHSLLAIFGQMATYMVIWWQIPDND